MPLLSIIIANYNYGRFLDEAIRSVLSQVGEVESRGGGGQWKVDPEDIELIVIDGGSTDNSVEIVKKYAGEEEKVEVGGLGLQRNSKISYWVSEPDKGQSDAFNKGFARAHGRFLTWLNADDVMLPGTVAKLKAAAAKYPACEWFVGGSLWLDPEMRLRKCNPGRGFSEIRFSCDNVQVWGPSSFFTKRLLRSVDGVDVRFHYMMDTDLWLRFARAGARYRPFAKYAYGLRLHPDAKMSGHNFKGSPMSDPSHPKWAQIRQEQIWMGRGVNGPRLTWFKRLRSANWLRVLPGVFDTLRFRGRHYSELT